VRSCPRCSSVYSTHVERCGIDGELLVEAEGDPLVGKTIDRYFIEERLGGGGMGLVYRAKHTTLHRGYAVKILFGEMASNRQIAERFRREARALSQIDHPNIVAVSDFGETAGGLLFLVMELVGGAPLAALIEESRAHGPPFAPARAARIVHQIATGLAEAHRLGFVHRDLKPANVMIVQRGNGELAKILDFGIVGIARVEGDATAPSPLTKAGFILGTPAYMAPEQIGAASVGPAADLYALGVILYELLAGKPPFRGTLERILVEKLSRAPDPLRSFDGLDDLAMQLLERDPELRPRTAQEVIDRLAGWESSFGTFTDDLPRRINNPPALPPPAAPTIAVDAFFIPSTYVVPGSSGRRARGRLATMLAIAGAFGLGGILWAGRTLLPAPEISSPSEPSPVDASEPVLAQPVARARVLVQTVPIAPDASAADLGPRSKRAEGGAGHREAGRVVRADALLRASSAGPKKVMLGRWSMP
jgi:serine/threonine-protein kinase